jgi:hypothetical protein
MGGRMDGWAVLLIISNLQLKPLQKKGGIWFHKAEHEIKGRNGVKVLSTRDI